MVFLPGCLKANQKVGDTRGHIPDKTIHAADGLFAKCVAQPSGARNRRVYPNEQKLIDLWIDTIVSTHPSEVIHETIPDAEENLQDSIIASDGYNAPGLVGDNLAIEPMIRTMLTEDCDWEQHRCAKALGNIGDQRALETIKAVSELEINNWHCDVKSSASQALAQLSTRLNLKLSDLS